MNEESSIACYSRPGHGHVNVFKGTSLYPRSYNTRNKEPNGANMPDVIICKHRFNRVWGRLQVTRCLERYNSSTHKHLDHCTEREVTLCGVWNGMCQWFGALFCFTCTVFREVVHSSRNIIIDSASTAFFVVTLHTKRSIVQYYIGARCRDACVYTYLTT